MKSIPIIVISLERAVERRKNLEAQFKKNGISNYIFYPAFDSINFINKTFGANISYGWRDGEKLKTSEICATLSHIGAIKYAQMSNYDNVIILEDDVILCDDWKIRIKELFDIMMYDEESRKWEFVYLSGDTRSFLLPIYSKPTLIASPKMVGAFSYMTNKPAYEKIINFCSSLDTTYDDMIAKMISELKMKGYTYFPFMTYHSSDESFIQNNDEQKTVIDSCVNKHNSFKYFKNKI